MADWFIGMCVGLSCGAALMWWHFSASRLIRSRGEYRVVQMEPCGHKQWDLTCMACEAWADYCEEVGREAWPDE